MRTAPALLTLALAACGGGKKNPDAPPGGDGDGPIGPVIDGRSTVDAAPAPFCTPTPGTGLKLTQIAQNLENPVFLGAPAGDARAFIIEQPGRIRLFKDGLVAATPFLDIESKVLSVGDEQGLLGLAFHPQFASNGKFYVSYSARPSGARVVSEFIAAGGADIAGTTERVLINDPHIRDNHNGGSLEFGPDGLLYIAFGDGGGANDSENGGQNPATLRGKILRIDVNSGSPYAIPPGNPWASGGGVPEMWAWGLRNPWRMSFDPQGNLFIGDVGQGGFEEIDVIPTGAAGVNFGWPVFEGTTCFTADDGGNAGCDMPGTYTMPVVTIDRRSNSRCSVVAGYVYNGTCMPDLAGQFFYGDYCTGQVNTFRFVGGAATDAQERTMDLDPQRLLEGRLSSFGVDGYGELYVTARNAGRVYRIEVE
ncbi:MAG: PQQ-dependent sugar dehydrogenase [Kofleriaceae bacterium]|nr:PQQ-dependent sugar dehydrogenase [Kofleriaceae bacterium]